MNNNRECAEYFKRHPAYRRCFLQLRKKWESYGRIAGSVVLRNASEEEKYELGGLLGQIFTGDEIRFSFARFDTALQKTRFAPIDMKEMLKAYFGREMLTNQARKQEKKRQEEIFFEKLSQSFLQKYGKNTLPVLWVRRMSDQKKYGYQILQREFWRDEKAAADLAGQIGQAVEKLGAEDDRIRPLAVLAAEVTGYPHAFDRGQTAGQLLVHAICAQYDREFPRDAHSWRNVLLRAGIVADTVSSFVHIYGLRLLTKDGPHPAYEAYCARKEPGVITLENLQTAVGAEGEGGRVYIVENEMVFGFLLEKCRETNVTLLCTSGQFRTAAIELTALLVKSGNRVFYSGDIDPEGVDIADHLWQRYGDAVTIWRMSPEDYENSLSEETISEMRLAKLEHIQNPGLLETALCLKQKRKSAYQENLINFLLEDITL